MTQFGREKQERGSGMDYIVIFDVIVAALGLYLIAAAYKMKKTGEPNAVLAGSEEVLKCRDKKGFVGAIYGQTFFFGFVCLAFGAFGCVSDAVFSFGRAFEIGSAAVFLLAWFWFSRELRKKKELFF